MNRVKSGEMNGCAFCDRRSPLFEKLTRKELEMINEARTPLQYEPGEMIIKQGAPENYVLSFTNGLAKIVVKGTTNQDLIVKLVTPQEFISGPGLFINQRHFFSIIAIKRSHVCAIDSIVFKKLLKSNHTFNEMYLAHVNENYITVIRKLLSSFEKQTKGRFAETLVYLADDIYNQKSFNLTFSIIELASLSGMSKESAFRCIKEFSDDGIISMDKKRIDIFKMDQLRDISNKG